MVSDVGGHVPDPPVELPHGPTEPYAEGQRDTANCRHCGQPIWIVYHGPRENHTIEGRARAQVCQEIAEALAEAGKSRGGAYWQPGEPAEFVERFALADRLSDSNPKPEKEPCAFRDEAAVICAFPATGKSYCAHRFDNVVDSDSSMFPKYHGEWPANYIDHIRSNLAAGKTVLASTHQETRVALIGAGIPFALVYPEYGLRAEYRARMERRGSPAWLVEKIDSMWDAMHESMVSQGACEHIVLGPGEFLADRLSCRSGPSCSVPSGNEEKR